MQKIWKETLATCNDCAMSRENRGQKARVTYESHLKCCTFEPFLPNYRVGALLANEKDFPTGVQALRKKIKQGRGLLPIGIVPDLDFQIAFNNRKPNEFGNRADWLCPYYNREKSNCGIWPYRGHVCETFFCKSVKGLPGQRFWLQRKNFLHYQEMAMAEEVMVRLGFSPRQMSSCLEFFNRSEGSASLAKQFEVTSKEMREIWDGWQANLEDFYRKCYEVEQGLTPQQRHEALGEIGLGLELKMKKQWQRARARTTR